MRYTNIVYRIYFYQTNYEVLRVIKYQIISFIKQLIYIQIYIHMIPSIFTISFAQYFTWSNQLVPMEHGLALVEIHHLHHRHTNQIQLHLRSLNSTPQKLGLFPSC